MAVREKIALLDLIASRAVFVYPVENLFFGREEENNDVV